MIQTHTGGDKMRKWEGTEELGQAGYGRDRARRIDLRDSLEVDAQGLIDREGPRKANCLD